MVELCQGFYLFPVTVPAFKWLLWGRAITHTCRTESEKGVKKEGLCRKSRGVGHTRSHTSFTWGNLHCTGARDEGRNSPPPLYSQEIWSPERLSELPASYPLQGQTRVCLTVFLLCQEVWVLCTSPLLPSPWVQMRIPLCQGAPSLSGPMVGSQLGGVGHGGRPHSMAGTES